MAQQGDLSRHQRIAVSVVVWVIVGPLVVGLTWLSWGLGLILAGAAVWTTYDYVRHGDLARHVVEGTPAESDAS